MLNTEFAAAVLEGIEGTLEELIGRGDPSDSAIGSPRSKMRRPPLDAHSRDGQRALTVNWLALRRALNTPEHVRRAESPGSVTITR